MENLRIDNRDMAITEYSVRQTELWETTTKSLSRQTKRIVNGKVLHHIKHDPYKSELLHCELEGLHSYNKIGNGSRIIFAICEDCRKRNLQGVNSCKDCGTIPDNTIMLFAFDGHEVYDWMKIARKKLWRKAKRKRKLQRETRHQRMSDQLN